MPVFLFDLVQHNLTSARWKTDELNMYYMRDFILLCADTWEHKNPKIQETKLKFKNNNDIIEIDIPDDLLSKIFDIPKDGGTIDMFAAANENGQEYIILARTNIPSQTAQK
jgi:hypothetical protein